MKFRFWSNSIEFMLVMRLDKVHLENSFYSCSTEEKKGKINSDEDEIEDHKWMKMDCNDDSA